MQEFWKDYMVVAIDMRGYNLSFAPPHRFDYRLAYLTQDVATIIEKLGQEGQTTLVGHDWGAAVAWHFAYVSIRRFALCSFGRDLICRVQRYPHYLRSVVVLSMPHPSVVASSLRNNWRQIWRVWHILLFQLPYIGERELVKNRSSIIARLFRSKLVHHEHVTDGDVQVFREALYYGGPDRAKAILNYYRNIITLRSFLLEREMRRPLEVPALMLWGEQDDTFEHSLYQKTLSYGISRSQALPGGHFLQQDCPHEVNRSMKTFLDSQ